MPIKIAFGHKARSGKDTAAEYLQKNYGGEIMRFSAPLYEIQSHIQKILGREEKKDALLLQTVGESLKIVYGTSVYANTLLQRVKACNENIYISDVRFVEEADMLRSMGFTLVRIDRKDRLIDRDPRHISEIALDGYKFDYIMANDGSIEDFYYALDMLVKVYSPQIKKDASTA